MRRWKFHRRDGRRLFPVLILAACGPLAAIAPATATPAAAAVSADGGATEIAALRAEIAAARAAYEQRLAALERRLRELEGSAPGAPGAEVAPEEPVSLAAGSEPPPLTEAEVEAALGAEMAAAPPSTPSATAPATNPTYFNPAISVLGNFVGAAGHNPVEELPSAELREVEMAFQAIVDPYARADFFLGFGEEGVEVEEGTATFTALPAGLLVKVGRMRASFGKLNTMHTHSLPWVDKPLALVNLLGGDEGWIGTGVSASKIVPLPGDTFSEATVQVFRGDAEGLFAAEKRSDLAYNAQYRLFRDLTEASNLDLALSYGRGPSETEPGEDTILQGLSAVYRWRPLRTGNDRGLIVRGEAIRQRRRHAGGTEEPFGWYLSGDYRLSRRWIVGGRWDFAEHADDERQRDRGQALTLTFWPSEFSQLRGELRRRRYSLADADAGAREVEANELLLQLQFSIGAHTAHVF